MVFSNSFFLTSNFTCYQQKEAWIGSLEGTPKVENKEKEPRDNKYFQIVVSSFCWAQKSLGSAHLLI